MRPVFCILHSASSSQKFQLDIGTRLVAVCFKVLVGGVGLLLVDRVHTSPAITPTPYASRSAVEWQKYGPGRKSLGKKSV
jgi:hypothetical protein